MYINHHWNRVIGISSPFQLNGQEFSYTLPTFLQIKKKKKKAFTKISIFLVWEWIEHIQDINKQLIFIHENYLNAINF